MKYILSLSEMATEQAVLELCTLDLLAALPPSPNPITGFQHLPLADFFKWAKFQFGLNPNSASTYFCGQ